MHSEFCILIVWKLNHGGKVGIEHDGNENSTILQIKSLEKHLGHESWHNAANCDSDVLYNTERTKSWPSQFEHVFKLRGNDRTYALSVLEFNEKQTCHLTSRCAVKL